MNTQPLSARLAQRLAVDPALAQRVAQVTNAEQLAAFAKEEGVALDIQTAQRLLPQFLALSTCDEKLTDDDLDTVAGGGPGPGDHEMQSC